MFSIMEEDMVPKNKTSGSNSLALSNNQLGISKSSGMIIERLCSIDDSEAEQNNNVICDEPILSEIVHNATQKNITDSSQSLVFKEDTTKFNFSSDCWVNSQRSFLPAHTLEINECINEESVITKPYNNNENSANVLPFSTTNSNKILQVLNENNLEPIKIDTMMGDYTTTNKNKDSYNEVDSGAYAIKNIHSETQQNSDIMNVERLDFLYDSSCHSYILHEETGLDEGNFDKLPPLSLTTNYRKTLTEQDNDIANINKCKRVSHEPRVCSKCYRTFKYPSDLKKHIQIHTEVKKFKCSYCERTFRRLHQLNVHMRIHTGEKPYVCNRCGMAFRHDSTLTMHVRTKHEKVKPFPCNVCGKPFGRLSHLKKHQKYVCASSRRQAKLVGNTQSFSNPVFQSFLCNECGAFFTDSTSFNHHSHHCNQKLFLQGITNLSSDATNLYHSINRDDSCAQTCGINLSSTFEDCNNISNQSNYIGPAMTDHNHLSDNNLEVFESMYQNVIVDRSTVHPSMSDLGYPLLDNGDTFLDRNRFHQNASKLCLETANTFNDSSPKKDDSHHTPADIQSLLEDLNFGLKSDYSRNT